MPAIRPGPEDTNFNQPQQADIGVGELMKDTAYDALYHSPIAATYRLSEDYQAKVDDTSKMISAEQANKDYGLDGNLNFQEPVRESYASLLQDRKLAEIRSDYEISSGSQDSWGRKVTGIGTSLVAGLADPVNLSSMFFGVGEFRALEGIQRTTNLLNSGLISPRAILKLTGNNPIAFNLTKGAINGALGTTVVQPFDLAANIEEQHENAVEESLQSVLGGAVLGAGFHTGLAAMGAMFRHFKTAGVDLDPQTNEAAIRTAVADLMQDKPIQSASDILSVDHNVVENERQQINTENLVTIAQEHLDRLNQLSEQGTVNPTQEFRRTVISKMLENPTSATPENLAAMFELKLNEDAGQMPGAYKFAEGFKSDIGVKLEPVQFSKNDLQSKWQYIQDLNDYFKKSIDSNLDEEDRDQTETASDHLSKDEFENISRQLAVKGYDILAKNVIVREGAESIVFLTNDKAIKLSINKGARVPGLTLDKEFQSKIGMWNIQVTNRVTPLSDLYGHGGIGDRSPGREPTLIETALNMLAKSYGINLLDIHAGNLGYDQHGNLRLIDEGAASGFNDKASPTKVSGTFLWNSLKKNEKSKISKEQVMALYNQLVKQIEDGKKATQQSILDKFKEIADRRSSQEVQNSSQKSLDSNAGESKNPDLERVKENRTPAEPVTKETIDHDVAALKKENADLEKQLEPRRSENFQNAEINEIMQRAKDLKEGVSSALDCITQKAL